MNSQPQQAELEAAYNAVRAKLMAKDFDGFTALIEPAKERPTPPEETFLEAAPFILGMYPDLSETKFQRTAVSGDWAAYYTLIELDDVNFVNLAMFKFHRVGAAWKLSGSAYALSFPSTKNAAEDAKAIAKEFETNPKLRL